ncbi:MAG TPA: MerR family transcriptional regulator [Actinoplanes sp.]|nr:MerR family transcriptional regulator [Actinoplanes sp.]
MNETRADEAPRADPRYTVEELARAVGMSTRNIRAHQTRRLLDPPVRSGRTVYYDGRHLRRLIHIRSLQDQGFNLVAIESVLAQPAQAGGPQPAQASGPDSTPAAGADPAHTAHSNAGRAQPGRAQAGRAQAGRAQPGRAQAGRAQAGQPHTGRVYAGRVYAEPAAAELEAREPADAGQVTERVRPASDDIRTVLNQVAAGHPRLIQALTLHGVVRRGPDGTVHPVLDRLLRAALDLDRAGLPPSLSLQVLAEVLDSLRPVADELGQAASARILALLHRSGRPAMPAVGRPDGERLHPGLGELLTEVFRATVRDPRGVCGRAGQYI